MDPKELLCGCCRSRFQSAAPRQSLPADQAFLLGPEHANEPDEPKAESAAGAVFEDVEDSAAVVADKIRAMDAESAESVEAADDSPHDFQLTSVYSPTVCDACSNLLLGLWNQGFQCQNEDCGQVVCHDCLESVPRQCPFVKED